MELLVLGGTRFLSREVAVQAVARGWDVTCACRGESGTVPDGATHLRWDRSEPALTALAEGGWDAVGVRVPLGELLAHTAAGVGADYPQLTWVDADFLEEHGVAHWAGEGSLPLWLPRPEYDGMLAHDPGPAVAAGLRLRPLAETASGC